MGAGQLLQLRLLCLSVPASQAFCFNIVFDRGLLVLKESTRNIAGPTGSISRPRCYWKESPEHRLTNTMAKEEGRRRLYLCRVDISQVAERLMQGLR